jgi:hypothetical protein
LGCTLPVSFFGGAAPTGKFGMFSAIKSISFKTRFESRRCQTLILERIWLSIHGGPTPPERRRARRALELVNSGADLN